MTKALENLAQIFRALPKFLWKAVRWIWAIFFNIVFIPIVGFVLFAQGAQKLVENPSLSFQFVIYLLLLPLVIGIVYDMISEDAARHLMTQKSKDILGDWYPLSYLVFFLVFMLPYFSGVSCTLKTTQLVKTIPNFAISDDCILRFSWFYVWHFLDTVPLLKIPQTMQWLAPHQYTDGFSGMLILLFKVLIIYPLLKAFVVWRQNRKKKETEEKSFSREAVKKESVLATGKA